MKKISTCILTLILAVSFPACSSANFNGSRIGNESQLIMDYKILDSTDSQELELTAGDIVNFEIVSQSGSIDIRLQKGEKEPIYEGIDIPTSAFHVTIGESGKYTVSVTGKKSKGSVSVMKDTSNTKQSDLSDIDKNNDISLTDDPFNSLSIADSKVISSEFEIDLNGNEATFLTIEVTEDTEATAHYSYSTREKSGAAWGYYLSGSEDKTYFELEAGTENVYEMFWTDKTIELKQGMNVFYITGDDISCKMHFEVSDIDQSKISYVGAYTKEEASKKAKEIMN